MFDQSDSDLFRSVVEIGRELMDLHVNYDQAPEYPLEWRWSPGVERSWRVEKMQLTPDRTTLVVNESLTLAGIPPACFEYVLGNRSALEWVIDQYQVSRDTRSGITSDPNDSENPEYIARHVCRVVYVSVRTVELRHRLAEIVTPDMFVGIDNIDKQQDIRNTWSQERGDRT